MMFSGIQPTNASFSTAPITDSGNDVFRINIMDPSDNATGDYMDSIDLTGLTRSGQIITINFQGSWPTGISSNASCLVSVDTDDNDFWDYFVLWCAAIPSANSVVLFKNASAGYWDGTGWNFNILLATSIGSASGTSITFTIPAGAYTVSASDEYVIQCTNMDANYMYYDWAPDQNPSNNAPVLSTGGVTPTSGVLATVFNYSVTYTDADNDPPTNMQVVIDDTAHDMTKVDSGDNTYTDGCLYNYTTTLGQGGHNYYFIASDGNDTARLPASNYYWDPSVGTTQPILSNASLTPDSGTMEDYFTFKVIYTDPDNDPPTFVSLKFGSSITYPMTKENHNDNDYTDGVTYRTTWMLGEGITLYYYEASDGGATTRLPGAGSYSTPYVRRTLRLYSLDCSPLDGYKATLFTFTIRYEDPLNTSPTYIRAYINDVPYDMSKANPNDHNYVDGCIYNYSTFLTYENNHYRFQASNGTHVVMNPHNGDNVAGPMLWDGDRRPTIPGFTFPFVVLICGCIVMTYFLMRRCLFNPPKNIKIY